MTQTFAEQRAQDELDYNFIINLMITEKKSYEELEHILLTGGRDQTSAKRVIRRVKIEIENINYEAAQKDMMFGALFFFGGLMVTWVTYTMASPGGIYLLAYGPIIYGVFRFVKGFNNSKAED